jgi:hypothetical protein
VQEECRRQTAGPPVRTQARGVYYSTNATFEYALAESWNGSGWTIESTPNPSGEEAGNLLSISCPSATDCTATGAWSGSNPSDAQAYAEQSTG